MSDKRNRTDAFNSIYTHKIIFPGLNTHALLYEMQGRSASFRIANIGQRKTNWQTSWKTGFQLKREPKSMDIFVTREPAEANMFVYLCSRHHRVTECSTNKWHICGLRPRIWSPTRTLSIADDNFWN